MCHFGLEKYLCIQPHWSYFDGEGLGTVLSAKLMSNLLIFLLFYFVKRKVILVNSVISIYHCTNFWGFVILDAYIN